VNVSGKDSNRRSGASDCKN